MPHHLLHLTLGVQRFDLIGLALFLMRVLAVDLLVIRTDILLLNKSRVGKHECTEIARCRRAVYIPAETHFVDIRDESRMIDMRMGEHDTIEFLGIKSQIAVGCIGLHSFTLVHTAIQKNGMSRIGSNQMFTARYFASSA